MFRAPGVVFAVVDQFPGGLLQREVEEQGIAHRMFL